MLQLRVWKRICVLLGLCLATTIVTSAQTFTTLVNFNGTDGSRPANGSIIQGIDGSFWGTTDSGGTANHGTIFKMTSNGSLTTIYNFCSEPNCVDGWDLPGELVLGTDGSFYGTTATGGAKNYGTVFKIDPTGTLTTIYNFSGGDGVAPEGGLVQGADGDVYGTTYEGGDLSCDSPRGCGTVFRITRKGALTVLHRFDKHGGENPQGVLVQGTDGNFYGTTVHGGADRNGTIFKITPKGKFTRLHSFGEGSDGWRPYAGLIQAADGGFYGTAYYGGSGTECQYWCGTIFRIDSKGYLTLYNFGLADGAHPVSGLIQATDGNFYGTTAAGGTGNDCPGAPGGCGTVFTLSPTGTLQTLHSFDFSDGSIPNGIFQATDGKLYGSTMQGGYTGDNCKVLGCGTIFSIDLDLPPFISSVRNSGRAGEGDGILGQGLSGTTAVFFNGTSANFRVVSDTLLKVSIPPGATSGYVTVTTPSGTLTSNKQFIVLP